jgi:hypothetical protein
LTLFASFVLSGLIVYWWVFSITNQKAAGLIAGVIFAFSPYRMAHFNGHLPLMGTQWLALHYAGLSLLFLKKTKNLRYSIIAGLGLGLAGLSSMYYLYMQIIITPIFVIGFVLALRKSIEIKDLFRKLSIYFLTALPLIFIAIKPYLDLVGIGEQNRQPMGIVDIFSASVTDFFLPFVANPLWGSQIVKWFGGKYWIESSLDIGIITIILSIIAIFLVKRRSVTSRVIWVLIGSAVWAMALAMGTSLHWLGNRIIVKVPSFLSTLINKHETFIPTIGYFLYKYFPFYSGMRAWMRYGVFAILFFSVVAGIGFGFLSSKIRNHNVRLAITLITLVLIGVEFSSTLAFVSGEFRPVDIWLNSQPGSGCVVQFPTSRMVNGDVIYGTLAYNKPYFGTFYGSYYPSNFQLILPVLDKFPDEASIELLRNRNVQYVIVDSSLYQDWPTVRTEILNFGLIEKQEFGEDHVFEFTNNP